MQPKFLFCVFVWTGTTWLFDVKICFMSWYLRFFAKMCIFLILARKSAWLVSVVVCLLYTHWLWHQHVIVLITGGAEHCAYHNASYGSEVGERECSRVAMGLTKCFFAQSRRGWHVLTRVWIVSDNRPLPRGYSLPVKFRKMKWFSWFENKFIRRRREYNPTNFNHRAVEAQYVVMVKFYGHQDRHSGYWQ